jgi:hypothetical protein
MEDRKIEDDDGWTGARGVRNVIHVLDTPGSVR